MALGALSASPASSALPAFFGALGTLTTLRASPASWTCVERWGGEREREEVRCEREREGEEGAGKTNSSLIETATHLGGLGDLDDLEGLSCGLNVDLFVRWEKRKEKEVRKNLCGERRKILGRRKHVSSLSRARCSLSNLLTLAGFALSASPASSALPAFLRPLIGFRASPAALTWTCL